MEQPQLALIGLRLDTDMQVIAPAISFTIRDAGRDGVANGPYNGGHGRPDLAQILARPGAHGDDQVDILLAMPAIGAGLAHGRTLFAIEVAGSPIGVWHEFQPFTIGILYQPSPHLRAAQAFWAR